MSRYIDTKLFSAQLRERAIIPSEQKILIARLNGSEQEKDLTTPVNCQGYGRIRHFRYSKHSDWSPNPLPILPAAQALGYTADEVLRAQIFQHAACNWRCWYCFVDFTLLSANLRVSNYFTAGELIDMYLKEDNRPEVIDLTGGQPDLAPEWVLWTMEALKERGLAGKVFLWSDDNLSNRYFWDYLTPKQRNIIATFPKYSRVACFKGYDEASFAFNTLAAPDLFNQQFEIYGDLLQEGLDMYAYVTFASLPHHDICSAMARFVDRLQAIHSNLPLRTVPLKIEVFTPTQARITSEHQEALAFQYEVHNAWLEELSKRFSEVERNLLITDVTVRL
ncbi:MAG: hypothetical protein HS114_00620 [Anaerolineales bacterium]|nr:hypothetical protein [Anaerolineales bacterium]